MAQQMTLDLRPRLAREMDRGEAPDRLGIDAVMHPLGGWSRPLWPYLL